MKGSPFPPCLGAGYQIGEGTVWQLGGALLHLQDRIQRQMEAGDDV